MGTNRGDLKKVLSLMKVNDRKKLPENPNSFFLIQLMGYIFTTIC